MKNQAVFRQFQRLFDPGTIAGLTDRQVLERFAQRRDPVAFEAIIARHGPLVFTVCRQLLRDPHDVDDAFQGTFLILIKKAGTLRKPERLGPWLYGVAYRIALRARARRRSNELPKYLTSPRGDCPAEENEQVDVLHGEIQRLPEKYRVAIVLCCIEGLSHNDAARQLGWPIGTLHGRLSRARDLLRGRLRRRGIVLSGGVTDALSLACRRPLTLPESMRLAAARLLSATVANRIATLTKGVLFAMIIKKWNYAGLVVGMLALGMVTMALLAYAGPMSDPAKRESEPAAKESERPKEHETQSATVAKTVPDDPAARDNRERHRTDQEVEDAQRELDGLLAKAALIQMELDITRKGIERIVEFLQNAETASDGENSKLTTNEQRQARDKLTLKRERMQLILEEAKFSFKGKYAEFAGLKRQIYRRSKTLGIPSEIGPTSSDLTRRLDELEKKIDRIIDSLPAK
jgi:RNA polymerase sigma factor (sigma-70 family)